MIKKLCILFMVVASIAKQAYAQPYVKIPDVNFANYLGVLIPAAMHGNSLNTTSTLVTTMTSLNVNGRSISNLSGVQYFTSLTQLYCYNNTLTNIPALPNSLTVLNCGNNTLTSLPPLPSSLKQLACQYNSLTTIPTLPNNLIEIDCQYNALTSLPILPHSLLTLYCNSNSLTILPSLPDSLELIYCENNNITCFPLFPNSIQNLNIDPNPFTCLPNHILAMSSTDLATPICGSESPCFVSGISQYSNLNTNVSIYPNPNNGSFVIEPNTNTKQTVMVYDVTGKLVLSQTINGKAIIDANGLNEGVYNLSISSNEGIANKRLVIVK